MPRLKRRSTQGSAPARAAGAAHGPGSSSMQDKSAWRYAAVVFPSPREPGQVEGPELGILVRDCSSMILWGPDYPPALLPPRHTILKHYPVDSSNPSTADWHRAQLQFGRDFPPRGVRPHPVPAWLAPDGRFYACRWLEHDRLGYRLAAAFYADPSGPRTLERHGWLRVQHDGTIVRPLSARGPTQPQLDVLFTLLELSQGVYHANIRDELEQACVLATLRSAQMRELADH